MKIIVVILQGLLLTALSYSQKCRKEVLPVQYYVYDVNVEINIYPCILTDVYDTDVCTKYNYRNLVIDDYPSDIMDKCIYDNYNYGEAIKNASGFYSSVDHRRITLCELPAFVKLYENEIDSRGITRQYSDSKYFDTKNNFYVFWTPNVCQNLHLIYEGYFEVWTHQNGNKYIRNKNISLRLTKKINFCDSDMWKTNFDGIIVSVYRTKPAVSANLSKKLQIPLPGACIDMKEIEENSTHRVLNIVTVNEPKKQYNQTEVVVSKLHPKPNLDVTTENTEETDKQNEEIKKINTSLLYLMPVLILLLLLYLFNVIVNLSTLRIAGKTRVFTNRTYLIYCLSQSLTTHYLYLDECSNKKNGINTFQSLPHLYETME